MAKRKSSNTPEFMYRQYFENHIKEDENTGCYLWTAAKNNIGYGMFRYHDKMQTTHRVQMQIQGHDIEGKIVYHTCDNYHCVNPLHLKIGTRTDKAQEVARKGRAGTHWSDPKYYKQCPHCSFNGSPAVYARFHGDKCKHKP